VRVIDGGTLSKGNEDMKNEERRGAENPRAAVEDEQKARLDRDANTHRRWGSLFDTSSSEIPLPATGWGPQPLRNQTQIINAR